MESLTKIKTLFLYDKAFDVLPAIQDRKSDLDQFLDLTRVDSHE